MYFVDRKKIATTLTYMNHLLELIREQNRLGTR